MKAREIPEDDFRCVCDGDVRCTQEWTNEADRMCDFCRAAHS